jgi:hypothetical protein
MSGTVTFSDDGSPLTVGKVFFETETEAASGTIDTQGHYVIGFGKKGNGLPKGTYQVCIRDAQIQDGVITEESSSGGTSSRPVYKLLIDPKFESPSKSVLICIVDGTQKTFDIKVDRPPKK